MYEQCLLTRVTYYSYTLTVQHMFGSLIRGLSLHACLALFITVLYFNVCAIKTLTNNGVAKMYNVKSHLAWHAKNNANCWTR